MVFISDFIHTLSATNAEYFVLESMSTVLLDHQVFGGIVAQGERDDFLKELFVAHSRICRGVGEILVPCNLRIGIGFKQIELTLLCQAVIQARVPAEAHEAVNSF